MKIPAREWIKTVFPAGLENGDVVLEIRKVLAEPLKLPNGAVWDGKCWCVEFKRMSDAVLFKLVWW